MLRKSVHLLMLLGAVVATGCKGKVGAMCSANDQCLSGACCNHTCVDFKTDVNNCGACFAACGTTNATAICSAGQCKLACATGFADCNSMPADGCEVDLSSSAAHCGSCSTACSYSNADAVCRSSSCGLGACSANFADCDRRAANGCEADLRANADNCGACGTRCTLANARSVCTMSNCTVASCNNGFGNCDLMAANGCEADFSKDAQHCGNCATACSSGQECAGGQCVSRELIVFGGTVDINTGTPSGDVWKFNLGTQMFTRVTPTGSGPTALTEMAYAFDTMTHRMILFGGMDDNFSASDITWALDFSVTPPAWSQVATTGTAPSARMSPAFAWDSANRKLYVFGGTDPDTGEVFDDTFVFSAVDNSWAAIASTTTPAARQQATGGFEAATGRFIINSGFDDFFDPIDDAWVLDTSATTPAWVALSGTRPTDLVGSTFLPATSPQLLFGGASNTAAVVTNAIRSLDTTQGTFTAMTITGSLPPGRFLTRTAVQGNARFIYGGQKFSGTSNVRDLWRFDVTTNTWSQQRADSAVNGPSTSTGTAFVALE